MGVEIVEWRDAHFELDEPDSWADDFLCSTVGWVQNDGHFLRIVSERTPNGNRSVTRVPVGMVTRRTKMQPVVPT